MKPKRYKIYQFLNSIDLHNSLFEDICTTSHNLILHILPSLRWSFFRLRPLYCQWLLPPKALAANTHSSLAATMHWATIFGDNPPVVALAVSLRYPLALPPCGRRTGTGLEDRATSRDTPILHLIFQTSDLSAASQACPLPPNGATLAAASALMWPMIFLLRQIPTMSPILETTNSWFGKAARWLLLVYLLNSNVTCRLGKYGDIGPIGSSQGTVNVGGSSWTLYYGYNGAMQVYSFVAPGNLTNWNGDVKNFYNYLQNNKGYPASSQYVLSMLL